MCFKDETEDFSSVLGFCLDLKFSSQTSVKNLILGFMNGLNLLLD